MGIWYCPVESMEMTDVWWKGKSVFVTGHTGFKGGWLSLMLARMGARVTGYALAPETQPNLYTLARIGEDIRSIEGDVRDAQALTAAMKDANPDVVLHLAAQSLVRRSYRDPVETYATNVMGTVHLLDAVRQTPGVRACVIITSDKCYENREWVWGYRENEAMGGHDPYSNSKGCAELVTSAYRRSFFGATGATSIASARAGNVIGGGDWAEDRLIPDLIRAFSAGKPAEIRYPEAIRPWQHVLEPLSGYLLLAQKLCEPANACAEGWNFGPSDEDSRPVSWIADRLAEKWNSGAAWTTPGRPEPHEARHLRLDCSKARAILGWKPRLALSEALSWIVEWHKACAAGCDMKAETLRQIADYENKVVQ